MEYKLLQSSNYEVPSHNITIEYSEERSITRQVFSVSLLGAYHRQRICLNYLNTCTWGENIFFLHPIHQRHDLASVLSSTGNKLNVFLEQAMYKEKRIQVIPCCIYLPDHFLTTLSSSASPPVPWQFDRIMQSDNSSPQAI